MDFLRSKASKGEKLSEPAAKRISTPAGQRLSVIVDSGDNANKNRERVSVRKSSMLIGLGDAPRESIEEQSGSGYSTSVWSDGEKIGQTRNPKPPVKRGKWKRWIIIIAIIVACIIALAVGLAVGLKKKKSGGDDDSTPAEAAASNPASPTSPAAIVPSSLPENFPEGSYTIRAFLDTVTTDCTSNESTWSCYPFTEFNTSPEKSLSTFNWKISSGSDGKYTISSTENPFDIEFKDEELELLNEGEDSERYRFQLTQTKTVSVEKGLTEDGGSADCEFQGASLQAFLYTKMAKTYPEDEGKASDGDGKGDEVWPFAVRIEQSIAGGESVPSCRSSNGNIITEGLEAQDPTALCSCLYKNWRTPSPY